MGKWDGCPVEGEAPDPCPRCGATVAGDDPVRGVCQAPKFNAVVATDYVVDRGGQALLRLMNADLKWDDIGEPSRIVLRDMARSVIESLNQ